MMNILIILIMALGPVPNLGQESDQKLSFDKVFQDSLNMRCVSIFPDADGMGIAIDENAVYVASGCGIRIFNRANPSQPIASIITPNRVYSLVRDGQYLYFLSGYFSELYRDLYIYDVFDPVSPSLITTYRISGVSGGLFVRGQYLYVTAIGLGGFGGLRIFNISNPASPSQVSYLPLQGAGAIDISGNYAYLQGGGFYVIDIFNPNAPFQVSHWHEPDSIVSDGSRNIKCVGNILYLGVLIEGEEEERAGLLTFNVSNPSSPQPIGYYELLDPDAYDCYSLVIDETLAYSSNGSGITVLNITNPALPFEIGRYCPIFRLSGGTRQIAVLNDTVYTALSGAFEKIDFSNPQSPSCLFCYPSFPGFLRDAVVKDNYAYVFGEKGLLILDVSNPSLPYQSTVYKDSWYATSLYAGDIRDTILYQVGHYFTTINISNPTSPRRIGAVNLGTFGLGRRIKVRDNYAYICVDRGLRIYDISNPAQPSFIGECSPSGQNWGLDIAGNRAYLTNFINGILYIIDISYPQSPAILGSYPTGAYTYSVAVRGETAYVGMDFEILILNCQNPASPTLITRYGHLPGFSGRDIQLVGNRAYITGGLAGCFVLDISNPLSPGILGSYNTPGWCVGLFVDNNGLVHTANDQCAYWILEYYGAGVEEATSQKVQSKLGLKISPKPTKRQFLIEYSIAKHSNVTLDILDTLGRVKKTIKQEKVKPGNYRMNLNISDLAAGVYFVRLKQDAEQIVERLVIVK